MVAIDVFIGASPVIWPSPMLRRLIFGQRKNEGGRKGVLRNNPREDKVRGVEGSGSKSLNYTS